MASFRHPGDNDELSVDRSSMTTGGAAFSLYTSGGRRSAAVFGVTVGEFRAEGIPCREDPIPESPTAPANPAHAIADYKQHGSNQQKKIAKRLKQKAVFRGKRILDASVILDTPPPISRASRPQVWAASLCSQ